MWHLLFLFFTNEFVETYKTDTPQHRALMFILYLDILKINVVHSGFCLITQTNFLVYRLLFTYPENSSLLNRGSDRAE